MKKMTKKDRECVVCKAQPRQSCRKLIGIDEGAYYVRLSRMHTQR
jgi:hypothetical protein